MYVPSINIPFSNKYFTAHSKRKSVLDIVHKIQNKTKPNLSVIPLLQETATWYNKFSICLQLKLSDHVSIHFPAVLLQKAIP